jgi:hypothetical protein
VLKLEQSKEWNKAKENVFGKLSSPKQSFPALL